MKLRAPAYPLITADPFFSVWSMSDNLTDDDVKTWFGSACYLLGTATIDGEKCCFMGSAKGLNIKPMSQKSIDVSSFDTIYTFEHNGVELKAKFTSPVIPNDIETFSKPISFLSVSCSALDGKEHNVSVKISASEQFCVIPKLQNCILYSEENIGDVSIAKIGGIEQNVLGYSGDDIGIDWGYFYLAVKDGSVDKFNIGQKLFVCAKRDFSINKDSSVNSLFVFGYDDIYSIKYFDAKLKAYWKHTDKRIEDLIYDSFNEYEDVLTRCEEFHNNLYSSALKSGGEKYAELLMLSVRQIMAAHKAVLDENGELLFISKECLSNGCAATVDVSYPSIPFFLLYNPELIKGMMRPIIRYAKTDIWKYDFAPHDVGTYPILNGQVYACNSLENQMPIEECGNMLIMLSASSMVVNDYRFFLNNKDIFDKWADYLIENGFDPKNQLCTDDFAGHLAHNCNLSLKTIFALMAYANLCKRSGFDEQYKKLSEISKSMSAEWKKNAKNDDESYALSFVNKGSFSMKYNAVWDRVFGFNLFSDDDWVNEKNIYLKNINPYGLPLDSRSDCTKSDWMIWTATLIDDKNFFEILVNCLWNNYNYSPSRVPMNDYFSSITSLKINFQHRSVQGGLFMKLLSDSGICKLN